MDLPNRTGMFFDHTNPKSANRNPRSCISAVLLTLLFTAPLAPAADLRFHAAGEGVFAFDTGRLRGRLTAGPKSQGIVSLVDSQTGKELTKGQAAYGLLSFYRLLTTDGRFGAAVWDLPKQGRLLPDGSVEIVWPAKDDHPVELTAQYRWSAPDTLDLAVSARPTRDIPKLEVFLGSYFSDAFRAQVYLRPSLHGVGAEGLVPLEVNPLIVGTYLSFPRDRRAARLFFDSRWDQPPHPVHWSVTRSMAGPLVVQHDRQTGTTCVLMACPEECFAVNASYHADPPDRVSAHHSIYHSLFGRDVRAGEAPRARLRLVVATGLQPEKVLEVYRAFAEGEKGK